MSWCLLRVSVWHVTSSQQEMVTLHGHNHNTGNFCVWKGGWRVERLFILKNTDVHVHCAVSCKFNVWSIFLFVCKGRGEGLTLSKHCSFGGKGQYFEMPSQSEIILWLMKEKQKGIT